jgi:hypothetical protein
LPFGCGRRGRMYRCRIPASWTLSEKAGGFGAVVILELADWEWKAFGNSAKNSRLDT